MDMILVKVPFMNLNAGKSSLTKTQTSRQKKCCSLKSTASTNNIWYVVYTGLPHTGMGHLVVGQWG